MRLVYVFDARIADHRSYVVRVPELLARLICRLSSRPLDYAPTPAGI